MGRRGPPKKPTKLKLVQGTARPDRIDPNEVEPEVECPSCPSHLEGEARAEWERIAPELTRLGVIARIDRSALAAYCLTWATTVEMEQDIAENGRTQTSEKGWSQQRPEVSMLNAAYQTMHRYLTEFGLTPASRTRVRTMLPKKAKAKEDPWAKLAKG